jgi:hypothetical protein
VKSKIVGFTITDMSLPSATTSDVKTAFDNWAKGFTKALNLAHEKS